MTEPYAKAVQIAPKVWWVGAIDWKIRDFHGYSTERGSTYNAFLIVDEKVTLIDTVKAPFIEEMFQRIQSVIDPEKIDFIISNHAEMDHSGALPETIARVHPEKVFCSPMGAKALTDHFGELPLTEVKTNDEISLGENTLRFVETRMLHWPDSMFCYMKEAQILFSQDGFGMHLASDKMYSDELSESLIRMQAVKYFYNILLPYAPQVLKLLEALPSLNLPVKLLCPDHGPLHRGPWIAQMLEWYGELATQKKTKKAVIVYSTMWGSTEKMAFAIAEGLRESQIDVVLFPSSGTHRSDIMTELHNAAALIVGTPTINNGMYPEIADILCYVKGLRPKNLTGGAFGSFGWSGEAPVNATEILNSFGVTTLPPLKVKYVPHEADLFACNAYGKTIADAIDKMLNDSTRS